MKDFAKILGGLKPPSPPANAPLGIHLNRDKIESNLSVPVIQGCRENALFKNFQTSPHYPWYVCRLAPTSLEAQPESTPDPEAGPKGILKGNIA